MRDVNGTRSHLLLGRADWERCALGPEDPTGQRALAWDASRGGLRLRASVPLLGAHLGDKAPPLDARRAAACDRHGNWYAIDAASRKVLVTSSGTGLTTDFWPLPEPPAGPPSGFAPRAPAPSRPPVSLEGVAVTHDHRLVVGATEEPPDGAPSRSWLLVFDLAAGGPPGWLLWPAVGGDGAGAPLRSCDLAAIPGGGLWVLARARRRLWRLDRFLRIALREAAPAPSEGDGAGRFRAAWGRPDGPEALPLRAVVDGDAIPIGEALDPIAVEAVDADRVIVVAHGQDGGATATRVLGWRREGAPWGPADGERCDPGLGPLAADSPALVAQDVAFLAERDGAAPARRGRLYAVAQNGNQSFGFDLDDADGGFALTPRVEHLPMRSYSGEGLAGDGAGLWYASSGRRVPLQAQRRAVYEPHGEVVAPGKDAAFDGREPDCVWHRLALDARLPPGAAVAVQSRAARTLEELARAPWADEPPLRRRAAPEVPWAAAGEGSEGTWELLFQHAKGRHLQVRLRVSGDRTSSPTLRALRLWYPRFSYAARYLPAVYREDPTSASFLERFLAIPEGMLTDLEGRVATAQALFGAQTAPADALPWLLGWLGAEGEVLPDEARRRLFLRRAMTLYRARGTPAGVRMALRLALDPCPAASLFDEPPRDRAGPRVVERFRAPAPRPPPRASVAPPDLAGALAQASRVASAYVLALKDAGFVTGFPASFPLQAPADEAARAAWERVARAELGLVPSIAPGHAARWRAFLRRRYGAPAALRRAYGPSAPADFAAADVPSALPATPAALGDWYDFESVVLARLARAHRFAVLLPLAPGEDPWGDEAQARRAVAERVVALQKPAHTAFEVRFQEATFRLGEARVGEDTRVDRPARAAPAAALGRSYAGESVVAAGRGPAAGRCGPAARGCACG